MTVIILIQVTQKINGKGKVLVDGEAVASADNAPTDGLVAYYPFNGNANDESGNGNDGEVKSEVSLTSDRSGNQDSAYLFSGNGQIDLDTKNIDFSSNFIVSLWIKTNKETVNEGFGIFSQWEEESGFTIGYTSGKVAFAGYKVESYLNKSQLKVDDDKWHQIVVQREGNQGELYIDGKLDQSATIGYQDWSWPEYAIGAWGPRGDRRFFGKIDDIRIYNRALSESEVAALYAAESGGVKNI